uniref:Uncharacterized protein n=2 Tax=Viruses TaxID=10239 RepID=A0A8S5RIN2_9VIRU|nr:MAG TPA: hypothetical protein [virus sp. ctML55]DAF44719.1 MAG TPA: hypothetical protein [Podoviridae sp. ct8Lf7]
MECFMQKVVNTSVALIYVKLVIINKGFDIIGTIWKYSVTVLVLQLR